MSQASSSSPDTQQIANVKRRLLMSSSEILDHQDEDYLDFHDDSLHLLPESARADTGSSSEEPASLAIAPNDAAVEAESQTARIERADLLRLIATRSSPPDTTKRRKVPAISMFKTFHGMFDAGDTQPMDSQVYKQYTTGTHEVTTVGLQLNDRSAPAANDVAHHVQGQVSQQASNSTSLGQDPADVAPEDSQITNVSPQLSGRDQGLMDGHFLVPKTPAIAGRKRDSRGRVVDSAIRTSGGRTSAAKTPGSEVAALLGRTGGANIMSLSQAFDQTQAFSSPLPGNQRSDPEFERPSPDYANFRQSSPPLRISSPTKGLQSESLRATSVPPSVDYSNRLFKQRRALVFEGFGRRAEASVAEDNLADVSPGIVEPGLHLRQQRSRSAGDGIEHDQISSDAAVPQESFSRAKSDAPVILLSSERSGLEQHKTGDSGASNGSAEVAENRNEARLRLQRDRSLGKAAIDAPVQIPMTSSRNDRTQPLQETPSRASGHLNRIPGTASQPARTSEETPVGTQTIAIVDSQKERSTSQKENDDPGTVYLDLSDHESVQELSDRMLQSQQSSITDKNRDSQSLRQSEAPKYPVIDPKIPRTRALESMLEETEQLPSSPPDLPIDARSSDIEDVDLVDGECEISDRRTRERHAASDAASQEVGILSKLPEEDLHANKDSVRENARSKRNVRHVTNATTSQSTNTAAFHTANSQRLTPFEDELEEVDLLDSVWSPQLSRSQRTTGVVRNGESNHLTDTSQEVRAGFDLAFGALLSGSSPVAPTRKKQRILNSVSPISSSPRKAGATVANKRLPRNVSTEGQNERLANRPVRPVRDLYSFSQEMSREEQRRVERTSKLSAPARSATKSAQNSPKKRKSGKLSRPTYKVQDLLLASDDAVGNQVEDCSVRASQEHTEGEVLHPAEPKEGARIIEIDKAPAVDNVDEPDAVQRSAEDGSTRCAPCRVLAMFRDGRHNNYYPATCIKLTKEGTFQIRFDDGLVDVLEQQHVRRLELRNGDVIKVDLPGMRKDYFIVQGLANAASKDEIFNSDHPPVTEERGFQDVVLTRQKDAVSASATAKAAQRVTVAVASIYLTNGLMWPRFSDRTYVHSKAADSDAPASTPAPTTASRPNTPGSRSRRATTSNIQANAREGSTSGNWQESGIFQNMAFAVSFGDESSSERKAALRSIKEQGATVLDYGVESLFVQPPIRSSEQAMPGNEPDADASLLQLTPEAESLGFVALITETYSRRAKYLQALALGLPCLHHRWVADCVAAQRLLPWERYLLPAGESAWLGGSIRSRTLAPYDPAEVRFAEVVEARAKLLTEHGRNVLLIDAPVAGPGASFRSSRGAASQSKKAGGPLRALDGRRMMFVFMTCAIGATRLRRVADLRQAKQVLRREDGTWGWVYVEGDVDAAELELLGNGTSATTTTSSSSSTSNRKRKRERADSTVDRHATNYRVVSDEFVIQSLILGALAD